MSSPTSQLQQLVDYGSNESSTLYEDLETLCLFYPGRTTGSIALEKAIDYLYEDMKQKIPANCCKKEEVINIPKWSRYGAQYCFETTPPTVQDLQNRPEEQCFLEIIPPTTDEATSTTFPLPYPLIRQIRIMANGLSPGTPLPNGITGELIRISSWEELENHGKTGKIQGKIVLYDYNTFTSYGEISVYRYLGGLRAASLGAIGVLIRTLTPDNSLSGPHTGVQCPDNQMIPSACLAIEDVEMISRLLKRGFQMKVTMILPCQTLALPTIPSNNKSYNLLFEIPGTEKPEELILIGGHIDSWDCQYGCCQGAHEDGQAIAIVINIIKLFHKYNLQPKRTIRAIIFTDEEMTQTGSLQYQERHQKLGEANQVIVAIETDCGIGPVHGFNYSNPKNLSFSVDLLKKILSPINEISILENKEPLVFQDSYIGMDIRPLCEKDQTFGLLLKHTDDWWNKEYFHFHHSNGDSINFIQQEQLKENFLVLLLTVWLFANDLESSEFLKSNN